MEVRFPPHPETLEQAGGRLVPRFEPTDDAVQAELLEREPQQQPAGLGRVTMAVPLGVEDESQLALPVLCAPEKQTAVADDLGRRLQHDGEAEHIAVARERGALHALRERGAHLVLVARLPVEPARDVVARLHREERVEVVRRERTQQQSFALERDHRRGS